MHKFWTFEIIWLFFFKSPLSKKNYINLWERRRWLNSKNFPKNIFLLKIYFLWKNKKKSNNASQEQRLDHFLKKKVFKKIFTTKKIRIFSWNFFFNKNFLFFLLSVSIKKNSSKTFLERNFKFLKFYCDQPPRRLETDLAPPFEKTVRGI